ncbi:MAG: enoyl-CoA hydratase/isomerase family protein [Hyphomonadaceae bacterium]|nr:enoyl-CoA hydratase/isomerase family protein [Hyphomonadaceae bacterium]
MNGAVLERQGGGLATLWLDRPAVKNAFDEAMIAAVTETLREAGADPGVRLLVLRGRGGTFCAGGDLGWMRRQGAMSAAENEADAYALAAMLKALYDLPQLSVCCVEGAAMGGGVGLVAAADVAIATRDAKFRFSEVRLGLTPATISPYVIEAVGARMARALFATAEDFDGAYAEQVGLVQYLVESAQEFGPLLEHLAGLAGAAAPGAVRDAKLLVRDVSGKPIGETLMRETAQRIAARRADPEGQEGLAAFLEKRKPRWAP